MYQKRILDKKHMDADSNLIAIFVDSISETNPPKLWKVLTRAKGSERSLNTASKDTKNLGYTCKTSRKDDTHTSYKEHTKFIQL